MKQIFAILLSLAAGAVLAPHAARATTNQPTYIWQGPGCKALGSNWAICSIDPPRSAQNFMAPCYLGGNDNDFATSVGIVAVDFCQVAKTMLDAPVSDRTKDANLVSAWYFKLTLTENENPYDATAYLLAQGAESDFANFKADMKIYNASPSNQTWQAVVNDLQGLVGDTSIINNS